jgi:L-malate glycosyltransferase
MRILFLPHNGKPYGANMSLMTEMIYLKQKHDVLLITPFKNYLADELSANNIKNINFPFFPSIFFVKKSLKYILHPLLLIMNMATFPFLLYKVRKFNPDIIYSNSTVENMGLILSRFLKVKHITHVREFGDLDYRFFCLFGRSFKKRYLNQNSGLIFNSNIVQQTVLPEPEQKTFCRTIYNGIEEDNSDYKFRSLDLNRKIKIGIVGYIHPEKRQFESVQYLAKYLKEGSNFELHVFGDGLNSYIKRIKKYIHLNQLDQNVFLNGFVKDTGLIYGMIDVLVVFARNEAFGRVTIEAMRKGVPVIGYNGGGTRELIHHGIDGFLFNDEKEFDVYFDKLVHDPDLYRMISEKSMQKIKEEFSVESYVSNIESFLMTVLKK